MAVVGRSESAVPCQWPRLCCDRGTGSRALRRRNESGGPSALGPAAQGHWGVTVAMAIRHGVTAMMRTARQRWWENAGLVASHAGLTLGVTDAFSCPSLELSARWVRGHQHRRRPVA